MLGRGRHGLVLVGTCLERVLGMGWDILSANPGSQLGDKLDRKLGVSGEEWGEGWESLCYTPQQDLKSTKYKE